MINKKFNRLTVLEEFGRDKNRHILYLCKCDCGNTHIVSGVNLRNNKVRSCGCLLKENRTGVKPKHGMAKTRFYSLWKGMNRRCRDRKEYKDIIVEDRWLDFLNFKEDMYDSYLNHVKLFGEKDTTLDRINPFDNYYKENCRWATIYEQNRNKKNHYAVNNEGVLIKKDNIGECKITRKRVKKIKKETLSKSEAAKKLWESKEYRDKRKYLGAKRVKLKFNNEELMFNAMYELTNYLKDKYNLGQNFAYNLIKKNKPYKARYKQYEVFNGMEIYYIT